MEALVWCTTCAIVKWNWGSLTRQGAKAPDPGSPFGAGKMTEMRNICVKAVHDYWHQIRPEGGLPHRSDFSPADLAKCLPNIFLYERNLPGGDAPPDYVVRLAGTRLVENFGIEVTGGSVFDFVSAEAVEFFRSLYECVLNHPAGLLLYFSLMTAENQESELEFLYLPLLLDKGGDESGLILGVAASTDDHRWLDNMGGRWDTPELISGGWLDLGFGKPDDPFLQNACAAAGADYKDY